MNTNEEPMTLAQVAAQMEDLSKELHKLHNLIKGAALFRDALMKDHPSMKLEAFEIFERVVRPLELAFDAASASHTALYDLSIGKGGK